MTTIERLRVHRVTIPLLRSFVTAVRGTDGVDALLVEAIDSDGRSGWGEAPTSWRVTGESPASVRAAVLGPLSEVVAGRRVSDLDVLGNELATAVVQNSAARSAVDCAVHDLAAQGQLKSLRAFLGGDDRPVLTDMTLSIAPLDDLVRTALEHVDSGFTTLKVKVGSRADTADAVVRIREAVGSAIGLRVDANQAWTADEAVRMIRHWEDHGVGLEFVEQPVAARDVDALAAVTQSVATPILADESVWTTHDLGQVIDRRAADLVNIKLAKAGGLTEARRLVAAAAANDIGVIVGCMMESHVGIAAAEALAATLGARDAHRAQDLDAGLWMSSSPVNGGIDYAGERLLSRATAGLGIDGLAAGVSAHD
ncbi:dipeptide epimerase [Diaminobutyricimonas sp. LJ205]|uniref:dipeptide epimerase n=1 Tax=Diaminobutyricimonas sp. LJ205 TaxID=2683590 RepID=UPI0012F513CC|nr:dipeptide epimerase [Diaminobutyricimonas sp. LJ205]